MKVKNGTTEGTMGDMEKRLDAALEKAKRIVAEHDEQEIHEVIVGNIGRVYCGTDKQKAKSAYGDYVYQSQSGYGRAADEPVTWLIDGDIYKETEA